MSNMNSNYEVLSDAYELVASRVMEVQRELAFQAWTTPALLAEWWGPNGFSNTFHEFDPRPGGHWRFIMHGPNGVDYPNHSVFLEVSAPERILLEHQSEPKFQVLATFEDLGGQTRVTFRQRFESAEKLNQVIGFAADANEQNLDRLQALLKSRSD